MATGTPKSASRSSASSRSSEPSFTPPRARTATSVSATSLMRSHRERLGRSPARRTRRLMGVIYRYRTSVRSAQPKPSARNPFRAEERDDEDVQKALVARASRIVDRPARPHVPGPKPRPARQKLRGRVHREHRATARHEHVVDAGGKRRRLLHGGSWTESQRQGIGTADRARLNDDTDDGVGGRAATPADRLPRSNDGHLRHRAAAVSPFRGEPIEDAAPHRRKRIGACAAAKAPAPESRTGDRDHAARRIASDDERST